MGSGCKLVKVAGARHSPIDTAIDIAMSMSAIAIALLSVIFFYILRSLHSQSRLFPVPHSPRPVLIGVDKTAAVTVAREWASASGSTQYYERRSSKKKTLVCK